MKKYKIKLGTNKFVAVEAIRGEMGWSTYEEVSKDEDVLQGKHFGNE